MANFSDLELSLLQGIRLLSLVWGSLKASAKESHNDNDEDLKKELIDVAYRLKFAISYYQALQQRADTATVNAAAIAFAQSLQDKASNAAIIEAIEADADITSFQFPIAYLNFNSVGTCTITLREALGMFLLSVLALSILATVGIAISLKASHVSLPVEVLMAPIITAVASALCLYAIESFWPKGKSSKMPLTAPIHFKPTGEQVTLPDFSSQELDNRFKKCSTLPAFTRAPAAAEKNNELSREPFRPLTMK